jgi:hypothetical protein
MQKQFSTIVPWWYLIFHHVISTDALVRVVTKGCYCRLGFVLPAHCSLCFAQVSKPVSEDCVWVCDSSSLDTEKNRRCYSLRTVLKVLEIQMIAAVRPSLQIMSLAMRGPW